MSEEIGADEIRDWVGRLCGSTRHDADLIARMRSLGADRLFPFLREILHDSDSEVRCLAALAVFYIDPKAEIDLLLPLLDDPELVVRWHTCGLLHDIGDPRGVEPLIRIMKTDPDPQVRGTAAYALGGIGDPSAIPALIEALDHDHEVDELGHTASSSAASALDEIIKTNHTRIKLSDHLCTLPSTKPDLDVLKAEAMEFYHKPQP